MMQERHILASAAISMFIAIGLGAFGAHGLKQILSAEMLAIWQTAVQYQLVHGLALFALAIVYPRFAPHSSGSAKFIAPSFIGGTILFSGSLYALALSGIKVLGAITPLGGVAFLIGWLLLAKNALSLKSE